MSENRDYTEAQLIELLRQGLVSTDPVPADVTEFAMAALTWRTIDAELAALAFDSASEDTPAGVRGSTAERMLSYETERLNIDIEYRPATRRLIGQVAPAQLATVELHHSKGTSTTATDDLGRFSFEDVEPGPVSIVCTSQGPDPDVIKTEWTVLDPPGSNRYLSRHFGLSLRRVVIVTTRRKRQMMTDMSPNQSPKWQWRRAWTRRPITVVDHPVDRWLGSRSKEPGIKQSHRSRRQPPWLTARPAI